jgi:flavin reductase (DIM6/NTAB) family NADH-FMN oxidoreductase RutF
MERMTRSPDRDAWSSYAGGAVRVLTRPTAQEFRAALGQFPTGVTVVATTTPDGEHHATTASSFTSLSLDPLLVLVCLDRASRGLASVLGSGVFSVSVLADCQEHLSRRFASRGRPPGSAAFEGLRYTLDGNGCPRFDDSLTTLECRLHAVHPGGDHTIVVGAVSALATTGGAAPLVFHAGRYTTVARSYPGTRAS